jgi:DNA-binding response OmpR family regulator
MRVCMARRSAWRRRRRSAGSIPCSGSSLLGLLLGAPDAASPRLIDTYVKSIRRKLGSAGSLIETVRGVGYRLSAG